MASWRCWRTVCGCTCHRIGQHLPSPILFFGCSVGGRAIVALHFGARVYIHRERRRNKEFLRLTVVLTVAMGLECEVAPLRSGFIRILWVDWWDAAKKIPRDAFFSLQSVCVKTNPETNVQRTPDAEVDPCHLGVSTSRDYSWLSFSHGVSFYHSDRRGRKQIVKFLRWGKCQRWVAIAFNCLYTGRSTSMCDYA